MAKVLLRRAAALMCLTVIMLAVQAGKAGAWFDDRALTVWVFDVGQGDALFIDAPNAQVLIDGGPSGAVLEKLSAILPPWDRTLDLIVATHPHADHIDGLNTVLEQYDVGEVVDSGALYGAAAAVAFDAANGNATVAAAPMTWDLGNGARLDVMWPSTSFAHAALENVHDANIVMLLTYGDTTMLLTGDAEEEHEERFVGGLSHVDVLKVGHHGSDTSTGPALVNITSPDYAIISVGAENSYGHPSPLVVDRLQRAGATVLRTDLAGDVRIRSLGGEPMVARIAL